MNFIKAYKNFMMDMMGMEMPEHHICMEIS